jgi:hypothetical protein
MQLSRMRAHRPVDIMNLGQGLEKIRFKSVLGASAAEPRNKTQVEDLTTFTSIYKYIIM